MDPKLTFKNGQFKIMQIADAQELPFGVSPDTLKLMELAVQAEKPDLIVFTGDQIYGIHPRLWGGGNETRVKNVITKLFSPVTAAGVPFAVTFGNHDAESGVPCARQAQFYAALPGYVAGERRSDADPGTFRLPVYGENGVLQCEIYAFDTHGSVLMKEKSGVTDAQLDWFRAQRDLNAGSKTPTPALVFQHIPTPEYYNVLIKNNKRTRGAVEAFGRHKGEFYSLPQTIRNAGGFLGEAPSVFSDDAGELSTLRADGGVMAVAAGHDHNNSFAADYKGMKLIYTQGAGFHVYGPHLKRGVRIFTLNENAPGTFETYPRTWESLTPDRPADPLLELFLTHTPSSVEQAISLAKRYGPPLAAAGAAAGCLLKIGFRRHKK